MKNLGGIENMNRLPDAVFIVDPHKERTAVMEANRLKIPIVALVDTNCDPDEISYPIPSNDDAIRAIQLMCSVIAESAKEGKELAGAAAGAEAQTGEEEDPDAIQSRLVVDETDDEKAARAARVKK